MLINTRLCAVRIFLFCPRGNTFQIHVWGRIFQCYWSLQIMLWSVNCCDNPYCIPLQTIIWKAFSKFRTLKSWKYNFVCMERWIPIADCIPYKKTLRTYFKSKLKTQNKLRYIIFWIYPDFVNLTLAANQKGKQITF